ncbi:MAG: trypsin-like serine protease [Ruminococcaceae bacterium]|nr:trypsin-like serine protease [Oscillospiraceae bacterium]
MDQRPGETYPKEPNYDLFSAKPPATGAESAASTVKVRVKPPRRNGGVIALCVVATLLLLIVTVACFVIIRRVVIPSGSMATVGTSGPVATDNPFARPPATTDATTTEATTGIEINDPPAVIGTTPVESDGVLTVSEIYKRIQPSVVSILVNNRYNSGLASGIILDASGVIVTNYHVVSDMTNIVVVLHDGTRHTASLLGYDASCDLAILYIEASGLTPATFGNSDALEVGDLAVAVGTPYNLSLSGTTTQGIISAINRDLLINNRQMTLIQTDASINPGNSGGPLINEYGQVIGIISMKIGEDFEGLGFAIPMNTAKTIIENIINGVHAAATPALGVDGRFLTEVTAAVNGLPVGFYITAVHPASDIYAQGVRAGDVIVAIDGVELADMAAFTALTRSHAVGEVATVTIYRDTNPYDAKSGVVATIDVVLMDEAVLNG